MTVASGNNQESQVIRFAVVKQGIYLHGEGSIAAYEVHGADASGACFGLVGQYAL